jgi:hypothetical protein
MATPRQPVPALLVIATFSRHPEALDWAKDSLQPIFGPLALVSPPFVFQHTTYYEATMGTGLRKQLLTFRNLVAPDTLAAIKLRTNDLEQELTRTGTFAEQRPLNLDPGLLTLGKFILATAKDQAQRIYLRDGIFAEVTLRFQAGEFLPWPWTYADYRELEVRNFLREARAVYRESLEKLLGRKLGPGQG